MSLVPLVTNSMSGWKIFCLEFFLLKVDCNAIFIIEENSNLTCIATTLFSFQKFNSGLILSLTIYKESRQILLSGFFPLGGTIRLPGEDIFAKRPIKPLGKIS